MGDFDVQRNAFVALCGAFRSPALLFAAFDLEVFEHVTEEGKTAPALARKLDIPSINLRQLLNGLVALNLLVLRGNRYFVPSPLTRFLLRGNPEYLGEFTRSAKRENQHWLHASEIIRGDYGGPPFEGETLDASIVASTLTNVEISNRVSANSMWPKLESLLPTLKQVIDVGGGHGYYSELLLERAPKARVTIYDLPAVVEYCKVRQASNSNFSRMRFVAGDALDLDYDQKYDLVLMNDLLVYFSRDEKLEVLRRARRALRIGGTLAVVKQKLSKNGCTPRRWALFSLRIFITTGKGYLERDSELIDMTKAAGFDDVRAISLEDERTLVKGRRVS